MGVTVELSPDVTKAFKDGGRDAETQRTRLEKDFNTGLEKFGKTNADAKALLGSGQKLRIICFGSQEARLLNMSPGSGILGGGGETRGDFDSAGKPRSGGTAVIAIDCDKLGRMGLDKPFIDVDPHSSGFKILVHELLHAANKQRTHPPDDLSIYETFVDDFVKALQTAKKAAAKKAAPKPAKPDDDKPKRPPSKPVRPPERERVRPPARKPG